MGPYQGFQPAQRLKRPQWVESGGSIGDSFGVAREPIAEVGIDANGSMFVRPRRRAFDQVYRAAMQVQWDAEHRRLFSPAPQKWSYLDWFQQIVSAVADEYGDTLIVGAKTRWSNIPQDLRLKIEAAQAGVGKNIASLAIERARLDSDARRRWREYELEQILADAACLWEQERYADYARLLAPHRHELSPARVKRLDIAKKRGGLL